MEKLILIILAIFIVACSDNEKPTAAGDKVTVQGIAAIGQTLSGTVVAYDYSECTKGSELAKTTLQNNEYFDLNIESSVNDHPVLIELSNFSYKEQLSDQEVDATGKVLYSVVVLKPDDSVKNIAVSFWTNLAAALTTYECGSNEAKAVENIDYANDLFSAALTFDINADHPIPMSNFESTTITINELPSVRHGVANAAVASYTYDYDGRIGDTQPHELFDSAALAELAFLDLRFEGLLNGITDIGEMQFGDILLNADVYRTDISNHMMAIVQNYTGLPEEIDSKLLSGVANSFHGSSASGVFGVSDPTPLGESSGPILRGLTVSNCSIAAVGTCCGSWTTDEETVLRTKGTVEFDVLDYYSSYEITSISSNPAGLEYVLPLVSNIVENATVPWRSGLNPVIEFSQDATAIAIYSLTVVFTNDVGKTLSVTRNLYGDSCTI